MPKVTQPAGGRDPLCTALMGVERMYMGRWADGGCIDGVLLGDGRILSERRRGGW